MGYPPWNPLHGTPSVGPRRPRQGRDDLRGDAVMQQVFGFVNVLLAREEATRQRSLRMRTYRIVPLAPTAGVVQWVSHITQMGPHPMGHHLTPWDPPPPC